MVGAPYFQQNLAACATDGRIAQIAFQHGAKAGAEHAGADVASAHLDGLNAACTAQTAKAAIAAALARDVWPRFTANPDALRPHIHAKFALSAVVQARK